MSGECVKDTQNISWNIAVLNETLLVVCLVSDYSPFFKSSILKDTYYLEGFKTLSFLSLSVAQIGGCLLVKLKLNYYKLYISLCLF